LKRLMMMATILVASLLFLVTAASAEKAEKIEDLKIQLLQEQIETQKILQNALGYEGQYWAEVAKAGVQPAGGARSKSSSGSSSAKVAKTSQRSNKSRAAEVIITREKSCAEVARTETECESICSSGPETYALIASGKASLENKNYEEAKKNFTDAKNKATAELKSCKLKFGRSFDKGIDGWITACDQLIAVNKKPSEPAPERKPPETGTEELKAPAGKTIAYTPDIRSVIIAYGESRTQGARYLGLAYGEKGNLKSFEFLVAGIQFLEKAAEYCDLYQTELDAWFSGDAQVARTTAQGQEVAIDYSCTATRKELGAAKAVRDKTLEEAKAANAKYEKYAAMNWYNPKKIWRKAQKSTRKIFLDTPRGILKDTWEDLREGRVSDLMWTDIPRAYGYWKAMDWVGQRTEELRQRIGDKWFNYNSNRAANISSVPGSGGIETPHPSGEDAGGTSGTPGTTVTNPPSGGDAGANISGDGNTITPPPTNDGVIVTNPPTGGAAGEGGGSVSSDDGEPAVISEDPQPPAPTPVAPIITPQPGGESAGSSLPLVGLTLGAGGGILFLRRRRARKLPHRAALEELK